MNIKKSTIATGIMLAMGGVSMSAQAALTTSSTLEFDAGASFVSGCGFGSINPTTGTCTFNGTPTNTEQTDMGGSFFGMDTNGDGTFQPGEKTALSMFAPIHIGSTNQALGAHPGAPSGGESPAVDNPWFFAGATGMSQVGSAISVISDFGSVKTLDFSGWQVRWAGFNESNTKGTGAGFTYIPMGAVATITCDTSTCSTSSSYSLVMDAHVPVAFTTTAYQLNLAGKVGSDVAAVPVPAAAWLFGSGLAGLAGVARRRRNKK